MGAKNGAKKEEKAAKPTQITVILRLAAGGYLVYLAFGLLQEFLKPAGGGKMVQLGCAVLFGAGRQRPEGLTIKEDERYDSSKEL